MAITKVLYFVLILPGTIFDFFFSKDTKNLKPIPLVDENEEKWDEGKDCLCAEDILYFLENGETDFPTTIVEGNLVIKDKVIASDLKFGWGGSIFNNITIEDCIIKGELNLEESQINQLTIKGSTIEESLDADYSKINQINIEESTISGDVKLTSTEIQKNITIWGSSINGNLDISFYDGGFLKGDLSFYDSTIKGTIETSDLLIAQVFAFAKKGIYISLKNIQKGLANSSKC